MSKELTILTSLRRVPPLEARQNPEEESTRASEIRVRTLSSANSCWKMVEITIVNVAA